MLALLDVLLFVVANDDIGSITAIHAIGADDSLNQRCVPMIAVNWTHVRLFAETQLLQ